MSSEKVKYKIDGTTLRSCVEDDSHGELIIKWDKLGIGTTYLPQFMSWRATMKLEFNEDHMHPI
jgi:hypothetical protein